jgi:hypothetical protein
MRLWLYNRIKAIAGMAAVVGDRIIASGAAENPGAPFLVVQMDPERRPLGLTRKARVQEVHIVVWVHDKPGSMVNIDKGCQLLKDNLPVEGIKVGNLSIFELWWDETGGDAFDDHFNTNCRAVMFTAMTRQ